MSEELAAKLARFTSLNGPTGFEEPVLQAVRDELERSCQRVDVDVRGNVYGYQEGTDPQAPIVMVTAHADEIGFIITSILPGGYLRFAKLGGPTDMVLPGQRVRVLAGSGVLEGVIGVRPGHVLSAADAKKVPDIKDLYMDVGASSIDEVRTWGVEPGTPVVFVGELVSTRNPNRFFGKCVDNRAGVLCVLETAARLASQKLSASRVFVIVVEEEVGLRGAEVAAKRVNPDVVLAIDTVPAGGTPDLRSDELAWEIGQGPLLKVRETRGLSTHGPLRRLIQRLAEENQIDYQLIVDTAGVTDATSAQQASGQIAACVLGLARKYAHSAVELFDVRDLGATIDLTVLTIQNLTTKSQLMRI